MTATTLLFLPSGDHGFRWLSLDDLRVVGRGDGVPATGDPVVAIAPAEDVALHWAELPSRSTAQAVAAARILAAEASATPVGELHVAVGAEGEGERPIGFVAAARMRDWLAMLGGAGIEAQAVVPAPLLLPRPDNGYVRADLGGMAVVRGRNAGFADDALLTDLVTGGEPPATLDPATLEQAIAAAAAAPPLDLRQGPFARRRRLTLDWRLIRRLVLIGAAVLLLALAIDLVQLVKYALAADRLDARSEALARTGLPWGETVTDVDRQLAERLSGVRGPGQGFSATVAAAYAAVRTVPGTEITGLDFQPNGDLRLSIAAEREALPTDLKRALEAAGYEVRAGTFQSAAGRVTGEFTVSAR